MSAEYVSGKCTKVYPCRKRINLKVYDKKLILGIEDKNKIEAYWKQAKEKNNTLFNGEVLTVDKIESGKEGICIHVVTTDYAHLTYVMNHEHEKTAGCRSMAAGGLIVTKDGYILLGKMGEKTSFPGIIQCIGGGISKEDTLSSEAPLHTVVRECYEETGIRLEENSNIQEEKYIYIRENMTTLGFCYVVKVGWSKDEIINLFTDFKEKDDEISKLIFLKAEKDEIKRFCEENKLVDYLKPVLFDYAHIEEIGEIEDITLC